MSTFLISREFVITVSTLVEADSKADAMANWGNLDTVSYIEEDEYKIQFQSSGDTTMEVTDITEPYIDIIE